MFTTGYQQVKFPRVSAAALIIVLRTITLSYGNKRFSGTYPTETPQPNKMTFCTTDNIGKVTRCAENSYNRLAAGGPTGRRNITSNTFLTILYLTVPNLFFLQSSTAKTAWSICTHDGSNDAVCRKVVPLWVTLIRNYMLGSKPPETPNFRTGNAKFQAKEIHTNNFRTVKDTWKKFQQAAYTKSERWRHFCFRTPTSGQNYFRSEFETKNRE
jgi:hypothetical protein